MAAKKRTPPKKARGNPAPAAHTSLASLGSLLQPLASEAMFLRLPLSPETAERLRGHVDAVTDLAGKMQEGVSIVEIVASFAETADALESDVRAAATRLLAMLAARKGQ